MKTNKETKYGYILFSNEMKRFYSEKEGMEGTATSLEYATMYTTELIARNKRDKIYESKKILFDVKKLVVEYTMIDL